MSRQSEQDRKTCSLSTLLCDTRAHEHTHTHKQEAVNRQKKTLFYVENFNVEVRWYYGSPRRKRSGIGKDVEWYGETVE